jgi:signal transduction histidine kinase
VYAVYAIVQIRGLERLQSERIDSNRAGSLLLLRIQGDLNLIGMAMRDMLDSSEPYPLTAWSSQFKRLRVDLDDAFARESAFSSGPTGAEQRKYLATNMAQFWDALDRIFELAQTDEAEARTRVRLSLQARQEALTTSVARLLVQNNEAEKAAAEETRQIYARGARNVYLFLAAILVVVLATGLLLVEYNRGIFRQVAALSASRGELAQQLITVQESTFRHISRELHDEFGQILTATGALLQRAARHAPAGDDRLSEGLREVREIAQSALDKVRTLSQALHPSILEQGGFDAALRHHLSVFQKQTGIQVEYEAPASSPQLDQAVSIHIFRVMQEALNNVARHSKSARAWVRLRAAGESAVLEVEDGGVGLNREPKRAGIGLVSMRERAELVHGRLELLNGQSGGVLVRLTFPIAQEAHV